MPLKMCGDWRNRELMPLVLKEKVDLHAEMSV